jgi:hypothetical protein
VANEVVDVLGATVKELTTRLSKLGADLSDMWFVSEEWQNQLTENYHKILSFEQTLSV